MPQKTYLKYSTSGNVVEAFCFIAAYSAHSYVRCQIWFIVNERKKFKAVDSDKLRIKTLAMYLQWKSKRVIFGIFVSTVRVVERIDLAQ